MSLIDDYNKMIKLRHEINLRHIENGVVMLDIQSTIIGENVTIGAGTEIFPSVVIEGNTTIGKNCMIGLNTRLKDMAVGDNVSIESSVCLESEIGEGTHVGPFAFIRPHSKIGRDCKIGDFVEVKNCVIGDKTKASHLSYLGDADIGNGINFGCGTIIVNYDGANKPRSTIEDGAFIGCNSNVISPVVIGKGAYIAAGSTITDDVSENQLAIARARQVNKDNWKRPKKI